MKKAWIALLASGVAGVLALPGCTTNEATGRTQLNLLSRDEEIAMGEGAMPQLTAEYGGAVGDSVASGYVEEIGRKLAAQTEGDYPGLPWEFTLLDSEVLNAFALPGGKVFISRGLAEKMDSEAELAFVLGHEVGHVTAQHVDERMSRQYALAFGGALVGAAAQMSEEQWAQLGGQLLIGGAGVYALSFDRNQESESDSLGIRYMRKAGYNPIGAMEAMQVLASEAQGPGSPEFLSTHPNPGTRLERIERILREEHPESLRNRTSDTWPDRYRSRLLSRLAAGPGVQPAGSGGRLGIAALATRLAHEGADAPSHAEAWCALCVKREDERVRGRIEGEQ